MNNFYDVQNGEISSKLSGSKIKELGFILLQDKESENYSSILKHGEYSELESYFSKLKSLDHLQNRVLAKFDFGFMEKEDQVKVVDFMVNYSLNEKTNRLASAYLKHDFKTANIILKEIVHFMDERI